MEGGWGRGYFNSKCINFWSPTGYSYWLPIISEITFNQENGHAIHPDEAPHTHFEVEVINV